jgi:DNA polymerase-3 subunit alpha
MLEEEPAAASENGAPKLPEWPQSELLAAEKELLGFYVTGHPLTPFADILDKFSLTNTVMAAQVPNRTMTRLGGMIAAVQQGVSKKTGKPYALVTIEDLVGTIQMLCINENYDSFRELLVPKKAVLVIGEISNGDDKPKLFPQEIMPLEEAPRRYTKQVHLRLNLAHLDRKSLEALRDLVVAHPGKCPLFLCFRHAAGQVIFVEVHERFSINPSLAFQRAAEELFGEETYYAKIDTTPPERVPRRWERRSDAGDADAATG